MPSHPVIDSMLTDLRIVKKNLQTARYSTEDADKLREIAKKCTILANQVAVACT